MSAWLIPFIIIASPLVGFVEIIIDQKLIIFNMLHDTFIH
ncbi:putative membrane protein [Escherichia coli 2-177-06_S3_C2]|nr:putative membrane protein [Escherichia coli 2-177-06_S3_C2]KEO17075.1 putative membrane protein [Escherichia coli 2-177-06_S3_C3]